MRIVSVLTGDLIDSTRSAPGATDLAMAALSGAAAKISKITGNDARFTRFRGDGWQICLPGRAHVLRATLLLLAELNASRSGLTTKLSIAVGPIDNLGSRDLADASGRAFNLSGRNLDSLSRYNPHFIYEDPDEPEFWPKAIMEIAQWQARKWTPEQAEAVVMALDLPRPSDEELARELGISRQAFQSRLKGSGLAAFSYALNAFEQATPKQETRDA